MKHNGIEVKIGQVWHYPGHDKSCTVTSEAETDDSGAVLWCMKFDNGRVAFVCQSHTDWKLVEAPAPAEPATPTPSKMPAPILTPAERVQFECAALRADLPRSGEHVESRLPCLSLEDYGAAASRKAKQELRARASTRAAWPTCPSGVVLEIKAERKTNDKGPRNRIEIIRTWSAKFVCRHCQPASLK